MKTNTKKKLREWEDHQLIRRYNYLKSKLSNKVEGISNQMKYIKYHLRKRGIKI